MNSVCQRGNNVEIGFSRMWERPSKTIVLGYTQLDPNTPRGYTYDTEKYYRQNNNKKR